MLVESRIQPQTLLLDTNVFIDFIGRKEPFFEHAERIFAAGYFGDAKLWVPVQSINDAFYILNKYLPAEAVQKAIEATCRMVTPIDHSAADAMRALKMKWTDYEDCLVAVLAEKVKADAIITRDTRGFDRSMVPAMEPGEWLDSMASNGVTYEACQL